MKRAICWRDKLFLDGMIVIVMLMLFVNVGIANGAGVSTVVESNGWDTNYVSSIGQTGSSFYAQSFVANVSTITKFGVVISQLDSEGQLKLAIVGATAAGTPNVSAPLYQGALKDPSTTGAWYYEQGINVPVTMGQKYWILIDGYDNAGASGRSAIGLSANYTATGEGMLYTNSDGLGAWSSIPSMPIAVYVEGTTPGVASVDENNGWNANYGSSIGETGSDFYAQSFIANVNAITRFGVVIREIDAEGEVKLGIAADNGSGWPNITAPLYQGTLRNPSASAAWFHEVDQTIPVTKGQKYWVFINGYNNAGATGRSAIGLSDYFTDTGEWMLFSNAGGVGAWSSVPGWRLAINVEGVNYTRIKNDINLDGKTDILWRNTTTGQNLVWYMDGTSRTSYAYLLTVADPAWTIVGTGDFNNDGRMDILWRNTTTGQNLMWYMNGASRTSFAYLLTAADPAWTIVGTGDFNNDGKTDILWRNTTTGQNMVWYMNGASRTSYAYLLTIADQAWKIVGTGDFNADGKTDILWRNTTTGQNMVWYMDGVTRTSFVYLLTVADPAWAIAGTGDFNADGKTDILWRNTTTGQNLVWYMDGVTRTSYAYPPSVSDQAWKIVGK